MFTEINTFSKRPYLGSNIDLFTSNPRYIFQVSSRFVQFRYFLKCLIF